MGARVRHFTGWAASVALALSLAGLGSILRAQPATPPLDGFQTMTPEQLAAEAEQLPATPLVFYAYAFVWVALLVYVFSLWRRLQRVERELSEVHAQLSARRR